jgi:hypothetical protein
MVCAFTPAARARSPIRILPFHHLTLHCGARFIVSNMEITLQYFDGCPNWTIAAKRLTTIAQDHPDMTVTHQLVQTPEEADALGFRGSPSILVDGTDAFPDSSASVGLACRIYVTPNGFAGAPTLDQLRTAIRAA